MTLPEPEVPLQDACSTIYDNTLYTYSHDAFQSLPLTDGAVWASLPMGVAVKGGVCVKSTPKNDTSAAALYIVGGTANSSTYQGMQRYTFANASWETLQPTVPVTQGRLYHNAVYLNASDSILVFAGTQDGTKQASSQTFTVQASAPYGVTAFEAIAPPAINPLLIAWSESKALYIGGSTTNTRAMVFSPSKSWVDSNSSLAAPLYNTTSIKAVVINGDDSSKTLYTFDMSVSPNSVNRTILVDANGNPVKNAQPVKERSLERRRRPFVPSNHSKRNVLTVADWPAYNATLAPATTRDGYTIARDQSGLVVIAGGNEDDVLCIFKARENCWANATSVLGTKTVNTESIGETPSASAEATPSSTSDNSLTAVPAATTSVASSGVSPPFPVKLLGAVLGSILAVAFILIAFLVITRWRRKRKQHFELGHHRRASGIPDEKDPMDFQDRGLPQMITTRQFPGHEQQASQGSQSSMAILMGRAGHKRSDDKADMGSRIPFNDSAKAAIGKPILQENSYPAAGIGATRDEKVVSFAEQKDSSAARPRPSKGPRRSSGWDRYWSGASGSILGLGASKRTTYGSERSIESQSEYSEARRLPSQISHRSDLVAPLKLGERPFELNRVNSGSPTVSHQSSQFPMSKEMSARIERPGSVSSMSSYNEDRRDAFSSGVPASVNEQTTWTPGDGNNWGGNRATTTPSNYSESVYAPTIARDTGNFPMPSRDSRFPGQPLYSPATFEPKSSTQHTSDMSWLNLGANSRI